MNREKQGQLQHLINIVNELNKKYQLLLVIKDNYGDIYENVCDIPIDFDTNDINHLGEFSDPRSINYISQLNIDGVSIVSAKIINKPSLKQTLEKIIEDL